MEWGIYEHVHATVRDDIAANCTVRKFRQGQVVFSQGDAPKAMYIVQSGRFEAEVGSAEGDVMPARIHGPGSHFGELTLLDPRLARTATVQAIEPAAVLVIPQEQFNELRRRDPAVDRALIAALTDLVVKLTSESMDNAFATAERRLAKRLFALAEAYSPNAIRAGDHVAIPVTQEHLAMATGCTRPTMNRLLGNLESSGIISRSRNLITVVDIDKLTSRF